MKNGLILLVLLAVTVVSISGCTSPSPIVSPTPLPTTETPSATPVPETPSATIAPIASPVPTPTTAGPVPSTATVTISGFAFSPQNVTIAHGGTVSWTNNDDTIHTIKFSDSESPNLPKGVTYNKRFDTLGTYSYHCGIHPYMTGKVIVV